MKKREEEVKLAIFIILSIVVIGIVILNSLKY